jgi:eukaryotic-like serine/threonine-protein kinase
MPEARKCSSCGTELPADASADAKASSSAKAMEDAMAERPTALCPRCSPSTGMDTTTPPGQVDPAKTIALSLPLSEQPGERIGRYKLLEQIGEGGFGVVYVAEQQEPVRRRVALKIIKLGMDTKEVIGRFEAERQALALMDHPNIAKVFDAGATTGGRPYFVMELVKGERMTDYCDKQNLTTRQRLDLFIQICHAIQHAHQKGIIHRDIKPSNILVAIQDGTPTPKVIDFGIAKATEHRLTDKTVYTALEQIIGTPAYMSPEQAEMTGQDIDTRSDIYSLGVLLYELLTGKTPFDPKELMARGIEEMRRAIREQEPRRPSTRLTTMDKGELTTTARRRQTDAPKLVHLVRGDLDWIVMKCLEKDRTRRYETANGLAADLLRHLNNEPVVARPPSSAYRFQKMVRRNKLACAAAAAVALALLLGVVASAWEAERAKQSERTATTALAQARAAEKKAVDERSRAEASAKEAKTTLSASEFLQGSRALSEGHPSDALAYLARSLTDDPDNDAASTRLATLLASRSWMVPTVVLEHGQHMKSAQFSPDGKRILTVSGDPTNATAQLWDAQSGQLLTTPFQYGSNVYSAQFSTDGKRILTVWAQGRNFTARAWDARTGQPATELLNLGTNVYGAEFSPDGKRIVAGLMEKTALVRDVQSGQRLSELSLRAGNVRFARFSPDGQRIVTFAMDRTNIITQVWDAQSGQLVGEPLKHGLFMFSAQFSPDGKRIVTAGSLITNETAQVWDAESGQPLGAPLKHGSYLTSALFSPDGKRILTTSTDHTARVWDAQSGQPLTEPLKHDQSVDSAQFSPDGKRIVTASGDRTARVWDAQSGQPLTESLEHGRHVNSAQFSPDGKRILTVSIDGIARVWDAENDQPPLTNILKHGPFVTLAQFSPDGKRIVTAAVDVQNFPVRVWDAQSGQPLTGTMRHSGFVTAAEFSLDGKEILTASMDVTNVTEKLWDAQSGQLLGEPFKHGQFMHPAHLSPDGKRIVVTAGYYTNGMAQVLDARTGQALTEPMHGGDVTTAEFSPEGKRIVTASRDGMARVWDAQSGQPLTAPLKHDFAVNSAQFSPDGKRIVTGSYDDTARVWDAQSGQPLTEPMKHDNFVVSAQFSRDGKRVVTASKDGSARVWDAQSGLPLTGPMHHDNEVISAEFSQDGKRIVTASYDGTARVWDAKTGLPLTDALQHNGSVKSVQFSPDGQRILAVARADYTACVWDVAPASENHPVWLPQLAEAISGQMLNKEGILEPTRLNRGEIINRLREELNRAPDDDSWAVWGRWFLGDPATRTISPFSTRTVPEYIEDRITENTLASLAEAEKLAAYNSELLERIAQARSTLHPTALNQEADVLAAQGRLVEAESKYVEALEINRKIWTNDPAKFVTKPYYSPFPRILSGQIDIYAYETNRSDTKSRHRRRLFAGAPVGFAAPFNPKDVAADPALLLHVDCDALARQFRRPIDPFRTGGAGQIGGGGRDLRLRLAQAVARVDGLYDRGASQGRRADRLCGFRPQPPDHAGQSGRWLPERHQRLARHLLLAG